MNTFIAHITIMPLTELLDPAGKAVEGSLSNLGLASIEKVRIGKNIDLTITADNADAAKAIAEDACKKLLYNAVMEQYHIEIVAA
jgi:phosphoribosylformylglycinamidine synthase subunit PurS